MSDEVLIAWGSHKFEVKGPSYERLEKNASARWEAVEVIGLEPGQQFLGPGEETISLEGVVYPFRFAGFKTLNDMVQDMKQGKTHMLVSGYGKVFGRFALREISQTESMAYKGGAPQKIEFHVSAVKVPRT